MPLKISPPAINDDEEDADFSESLNDIDDFLNVENSSMHPKTCLIEFIKTAEDNKPYPITIKGNEDLARKFIHRMRVELSRFRNELRELGRIPKQFRVITHEIIENNNQTCTFYLIKTSNQQKTMSEELQSVMAELCIEKD